jgi:hypothetical protein
MKHHIIQENPLAMSKTLLITYINLFLTSMSTLNERLYLGLKLVLLIGKQLPNEIIYKIFELADFDYFPCKATLKNPLNLPLDFCYSLNYKVDDYFEYNDDFISENIKFQDLSTSKEVTKVDTTYNNFNITYHITRIGVKFYVDVKIDDNYFSNVTKDFINYLKIVLNNAFYTKSNYFVGHANTMVDTLRVLSRSVVTGKYYNFIGGHARKRYNKASELNIKELTNLEREIYQSFNNLIKMPMAEFKDMLDFIDLNNEGKYERDITLILWLSGNTMTRIIEFKENQNLKMSGQQNLYTYNQCGYNFKIPNKKQDKKMILAVKTIVNRWSSIWGKQERTKEIFKDSQYKKEFNESLTSTKLIFEVDDIPIRTGFKYHAESKKVKYLGFKDFRRLKLKDVYLEDIRTVKVLSNPMTKTLAIDYLKELPKTLRYQIMDTKRINVALLPNIKDIWRVNKRLITCQTLNLKANAINTLGYNIDDFIEEALLYVLFNAINIDITGIIDSKVAGYVSKKIKNIKSKYKNAKNEKILETLEKLVNDRLNSLNSMIIEDNNALKQLVDKLLSENNENKEIKEKLMISENRLKTIDAEVAEMREIYFSWFKISEGYEKTKAGQFLASNPHSDVYAVFREWFDQGLESKDIPKFKSFKNLNEELDKKINELEKWHAESEHIGLINEFLVEIKRLRSILAATKLPPKEIIIYKTSPPERIIETIVTPPDNSIIIAKDKEIHSLKLAKIKVEGDMIKFKNIAEVYDNLFNNYVKFDSSFDPHPPVISYTPMKAFNIYNCDSFISASGTMEDKMKLLEWKIMKLKYNKLAGIEASLIG